MENNKTKLTLSCDKKIIEEAKKYAEINNDSVSNIVSEFLETYITINKNINDHDHAVKEKIKLVRKFSGSFSLGTSRDYKKEYLNNKIKSPKK